MKAISIHAEYVGEIAIGEKIEEYRNWSTMHRGDLLICCTATKQSKGFAALVVELTDCIKNNDGTYSWQLKSPRAIKPFIVKGKQRLFDIDFIPEYIGTDEEYINKIYDEFDKEVAK